VPDEDVAVDEGGQRRFAARSHRVRRITSSQATLRLADAVLGARRDRGVSASLASGDQTIGSTATS
jgi:hypothetical protein